LRYQHFKTNLPSNGNSLRIAVDTPKLKSGCLDSFFLIGNFQTEQLSNKFMSKGQSNEVVLKFPKICEYYYIFSLKSVSKSGAEKLSKMVFIWIFGFSSWRS